MSLITTWTKMADRFRELDAGHRHFLLAQRRRDAENDNKKDFLCASAREYLKKVVRSGEARVL